MTVSYKKLGPLKYVAEVDKKQVAFATVNDSGNFVQSLFVALGYRRQGIGTGMVEFIAKSRGKKLNRAPDSIKNASIKQMSVKLGDTLGPEVELK